MLTAVSMVRPTNHGTLFVEHDGGPGWFREKKSILSLTTPIRNSDLGFCLWVKSDGDCAGQVFIVRNQSPAESAQQLASPAVNSFRGTLATHPVASFA
jgi:hypothetical protein